MILTSRLVNLLSATARPFRPAHAVSLQKLYHPPCTGGRCHRHFRGFPKAERFLGVLSPRARRACRGAPDGPALNRAKPAGNLPEDGAAGLTLQARAIDRRSRRISRAALCPGTAPTPPPRYAQDPP